jgi:MFS transporter, BCD family, chlorophyll transporter
MSERAASAQDAGFGWLAIIRLGLVQASLGAMVVLTTSTLNRVMVVELGLAAMVPGFLVGLHYAVQLSRPLFGHGSDAAGRRRAPWIIGGMVLLALAGTLAAASTLALEAAFWPGFALACLAYTLIGAGIGASGTSLLALLASRTAPARRPAAATIVWIMMIAGIVVTAATTGANLDPYSHLRLVTVTAIVGVVSVVVTLGALYRLESADGAVERQASASRAASAGFAARLAETWADADARLFTVFIFVSMLAYSTQDLIMEPYAGLVFGLTPGETTKLSGVQHGGILVGMILVGLAGVVRAGRKPGVLKAFIMIGCLGSAVALAALAASAASPAGWPLRVNVAVLGFFNGLFSIAAIGSMMTLAGRARTANGEETGHEGIRMGVWGAAQAIAFGLGGFLGTVLADAARALTGDVATAYASVFWLEAMMFVVSAWIAGMLALGAASGRSMTTTQSNLQPAE